jgi:hypothetical protein
MPFQSKAASTMKAFESQLSSTMEINAEPLAVNPLLGDERRLQEGQHCEQTSSLLTTFVSDTQAYGVMFTVRGKEETLLIETLELSSVFLANQREIHVMVYTKEGGYQNFQDDPSAWVKIADTNITPAKEGHGTLIPARQFHPVQVDPYNVRAFYVTLDTTDLRYSNAPGRPVGSVYAQDEFLQVQVGAGLLEYPFSGRIFEPRVFCGTVHYKRIVDCDVAAIAASKVAYSFLVQHDNMSDNVVISQVNAIVQGSINALLSTDPEMVNLKQTASLSMEAVDTTVSTAFNPEAYAECVSGSVRKCTALATEVTFKHKEELTKGDLIYRMLRYRAQITSNLNLGNSMDVSYNGLVPLETSMLMRLDRVPSDQTLNAKQRSYIESTTKNFLEDKLSRNPSVTILGVRVNNNIYDGARRRLAVDEGRQLQDGSLAAFDVSATVTASLRPPPFVNFNYLVEDAIDFNADEFRNDLVKRRDLQLDLQDGKFFKEIENVAARPVNGTDRNTNVSKSEDNNSVPGWGIVLIILSILLVGAAAIYFAYREIYGKDEEKEVKSRRRSTQQEDYMTQVYENAFRGLNENEAEVLEASSGGGKGSGHQRKLSLPRSNKNPPPPAQRKMPPPPGAGRLGTGSSDSRGGRIARNMGVANPSYSSRGLEAGPPPPQGQYTDQNYGRPAGTMDTASSDYARRNMARAPTDRGDDANSVGMGVVSNYSRNRSARSMGERSGSGRTSRSSSGRSMGDRSASGRASSRSMAEEKAPIPGSGGTARIRSTGGMPNQNADIAAPIAMRAPAPARIAPANSGYDDDMSSVGDMSSMQYGSSSHSKGIPTSSHHTVKRNNGRDNRASGSMGVSSQHTLKHTNTSGRNSGPNASGRNLGSKQGSGIDQILLQSYMQDPEALLETGGQRS